MSRYAGEGAARTDVKFLYAGGPCTCRHGRYVRYVIPAMPGIPVAIVSCRDREAGKEFKNEHAVPKGTEILLRHPVMETER